MRPVDRSTAALRGQSTVDFVIGFGVFFLTLSFVLLLLPDLFSPFSAQEGPAVADRSIELLSSDLLATGGVGTLNATCTEAFFARSNACGFDGSDPTPRILNVSSEYRFNVTIEQNLTTAPRTEVVCYNGSAIGECGATGGTRFARGPAPPGDTESVRTARRVVRIADETVFLKLRVW